MTGVDKTWVRPGATVAKPPSPCIKEALREHELSGQANRAWHSSPAVAWEFALEFARKGAQELGSNGIQPEESRGLSKHCTHHGMLLIFKIILPTSIRHTEFLNFSAMYSSFIWLHFQVKKEQPHF